jgi:hypothetical protein
MRILTSLALGAALIAAPATALSPKAQAKAEARLAKVLEGRTAGKPVNCINLRDIQSTEIIDGTAIVYRTSSRRLYLNRPVGGTSLDSDDILVTNTYGSQLCSIDTVRLVNRVAQFPRGFVSLGEFVPYTRDAAGKAGA